MYVVIMAGGSGTRFWPASRRDKPKQFLNISGKEPMVLETCNRLRPLASEKEMILVLGREHLKNAHILFKNQDVHLVAEPVGRNTAPCIGLGAIYARHLGCSGAVAFLPADHFIRNPSVFVRDLSHAGEIAQSGGIVTLGIIPTRPETGYGYIRRAKDQPDSTQSTAYQVSAFVEKPDLERAQEYLAGGEYFWNAGIFVATPNTIMKEIQNCLPDLYEALRHLEQALGTEAFETEIEDVYPALKAISFDYGIMEKATCPIFVLPCECGWSDVGSWASLYALKEHTRDPRQNLIEGEPILIDCEKSFISSRSDRLVACLGLENLLVVDTPDALLIADLEKSEEIRKIVAQLRKTQREEYL
jgi:mannose-1-phosphate guanylyltransferase